MDPAVGCFVACMPTWSPLIKPLQQLPSWITSLRSLLTRTGSRKGTVLPDQPGSNEFHLPQYKHTEVTSFAQARKAHSTESQDEMLAHPSAVVVKREFTQEHFRQGSDTALPMHQDV